MNKKEINRIVEQKAEATIFSILFK